MAATLYSVPISGTANNLFTYTGNITGAMSTYNTPFSAVFSGPLGAVPNEIYNEYIPQEQEFTDLDGGNFRIGRTYYINAKTNFNLGVSGTDYKAITNKRFIHSRAPNVAGAGGSNFNTIGFDIFNEITPLSSAFDKTWQEFAAANPSNSIVVQRPNDATGRTTTQIWSLQLQQFFDGQDAAGKARLLDPALSPNYFWYIHPLSSYLIYSNLAAAPNSTVSLSTSMSAKRTKSFLMSEQKDVFNDNTFITTENGTYITI